MTRALLLTIALACAITLSSCGNGSGECSVNAEMTPAMATVNHQDMAPANQQTFQVQRTISDSCVMPAVMQNVYWTSSDPTNAPVTSSTTNTQNSATAVVTCNATTTATIKAGWGITPDARLSPVATATLICQ